MIVFFVYEWKNNEILKKLGAKLLEKHKYIIFLLSHLNAASVSRPWCIRISQAALIEDITKKKISCKCEPIEYMCLLHLFIAGLNTFFMLRHTNKISKYHPVFVIIAYIVRLNRNDISSKLRLLSYMLILFKNTSQKISNDNNT